MENLQTFFAEAVRHNLSKCVPVEGCKLVIKGVVKRINILLQLSFTPRKKAGSFLVEAEQLAVISSSGRGCVVRPSYPIVAVMEESEDYLSRDKELSRFFDRVLDTLINIQENEVSLLEQ